MQYALMLLGALALLFLAALWFLRTVWFHRDPDHSDTPQNDRAIRSPVYGRVAYIRRVTDASVESEKIGERIPVRDITHEDWPPDCPDGSGWLIGIAMTALDVHFQYAPVAGTVTSIRHFPTGRNLAMFDFWEYVRITYFRRAVQLFARRYTFDNERQTMWIAGKQAKVGLVLIADKFVDKITTFVQIGQSVPAGGKLSFIGRGSQVDVVICGHLDLTLLVKEGDPVYGPKTLLARLTEGGGAEARAVEQIGAKPS
jgi:phosphatidylserine decarboxylase